MRPARRLHDGPRLAGGLIEPVEARIGIRLHQPGIARQMLLGMLAGAVARVEEGGGRRVRPAERLVVAHIGP